VSPSTITEQTRRPCPVVPERASVADATRAVLDSGLPALPVVDERERLVGIFGEREFVGALFPKYLQTLGYAGYVPKAIDEVLEKRRECAGEAVGEHVNREHVDVPPDASDVQVAETFLHHRVLIVPVVADGRVLGVVTRGDFFRALAERFLARP
jgi:CBS domain-containing protein